MLLGFTQICQSSLPLLESIKTVPNCLAIILHQLIGALYEFFRHMVLENRCTIFFYLFKKLMFSILLGSFFLLLLVLLLLNSLGKYTFGMFFVNSANRILEFFGPLFLLFIECLKVFTFMLFQISPIVFLLFHLSVFFNFLYSLLFLLS